MTKKDFVKIAEAVRDARLAMGYAVHDDLRPTHEQVFNSMARTIADVCSQQNPKFDRKKFLAVCGVSL